MTNGCCWFSLKKIMTSYSSMKFTWEVPDSFAHLKTEWVDLFQLAFVKGEVVIHSPKSFRAFRKVFHLVRRGVCFHLTTQNEVYILVYTRVHSFLIAFFDPRIFIIQVPILMLTHEKKLNLSSDDNIVM